MDLLARRHFVETILRFHEQGDRLPAVPLELYLQGNTDDESLGKGMRRDFDLEAYAAVLRRLAAREEVAHVFVEVHEVPDLDEPEDRDLWGQAFVVHVVTTLSAAALQAEVASLAPISIDEGWCAGPGIRPPIETIEPPFRPLRIALG